MNLPQNHRRLYPEHYWVSWNLRTVPAKCSAKGLPQNFRRRLHSDLHKVTQSPVDYGWPLPRIGLSVRIVLLLRLFAKLKGEVDECPPL